MLTGWNDKAQRDISTSAATFRDHRYAKMGAGIAAAAAGIAKILFFIFLVICVILLVVGLMAGRAIS